MKTLLRTGLLICGLPVCLAQTPPPAEGGGLWDNLRSLQEKAAASGREVPQDLMQWLREDAQRGGGWEYRVVDMDNAQAAAVEDALNALGRERWEVFWAQADGPRLRLLARRPTASYLQSVPMSELLRLLPRQDGGGSQ